MSYKHGVYIEEYESKALPPRRVETAIPVVVGTAPVLLADGEAKVNEPVLCYSYQEAVSSLGYLSDWGKFTLGEFMRVYYGLFQVAPAVFINVLDPDTHKTEITDEQHTFDDNGTIQLKNQLVLEDSINVTSEDGLTTYEKDTDYVVSTDTTTGLTIITRKDNGTIPAGATVSVNYTHCDPTKVTADDIIGGVDATTGKRKGLELVNEVFPRFRVMPGSIIAPGWSKDVSVAVSMGSIAKNINNHFKAMAIVDVDDTQALKYSDVVSYKNDNNLTGTNMIVCWPRVRLGNETYWMSSQVAALLARTDAENADLPFESPSNKRFLIDSAVANNNEVWLGPDEANYLNGNGIVTALNWIGGWRCWGNRTGAYPSSTDVKDTIIPIRRMFNFVGNTLTLTAWQRIDFPIRRRIIETTVDSFNIWLNGLAAKEAILGGRVQFLEEENPTTDLADGIIRFHVYITPPSPAREIDFVLEYDANYLKTLFE